MKYVIYLFIFSSIAICTYAGYLYGKNTASTNISMAEKAVVKLNQPDPLLEWRQLQQERQHTKEKIVQRMRGDAALIACYERRMSEVNQSPEFYKTEPFSDWEALKQAKEICDTENGY